MSMGGNDPPPAPNPQATIQQATQSNVTTGAANQAGSMVNQSNPWADLTYEQQIDPATGKPKVGPGGVPLYQSNSNISPTLSSILMSLQGGGMGALNNLGGGQGKAPWEAIGDMSSGLTGQMLDKKVSYMQPFFGQQKEELDTQLRNQGIGPETPAYAKAMNNLNQSQDQAITGYLSTAEPTAYNQAVQSLYGIPLQQLTALMGLANPQALGVQGSFINPPQTNIAPTDVGGIVNTGYANQVKAYEAQTAKDTAMMNGLFGIGAGVAGKYAGSAAGSAAITSLLSGI